MTTAADAGPTKSTSPDGRRVWVQDRLVSAEEARVSATDHGLVAGGGVFESLKVTSDGAFAISRHLARLSRSAKALGLPEPDHQRVREAIEAVAAECDYEVGIVRVTWTGGVGPLGSSAAFGPPTLVVADAPTPAAPENTAIVTLPWLRNERGAMTGIKTTSYAENIRGLGHAHERDASEGVFVNTAGNVSEGTGANLFVVLDGEVVTSPLSSGALAGITRDLVRAWSPVVERDLTLAEAQAADEVFLTSSLRDVQRVTRWDDRRYADDGPVVAGLRELFAERAAADLDPV
ncbi:aminotransferase class IV [Auraticoccus monumenti]|nr:aminotransferase class IV [Auraticoccus monumenti]